MSENTDTISELKSIKTMLSKLLNKTEVIKQFDDKTYTVIEPLYTPFGEVDAHGDGYLNSDGPNQLVDNFEKYKSTMQKAINHTTQTDCFDIVKAWVNDKPRVMNGVEIPAKQPMVELRYNEKAYQMRKDGRLTAPSIGCAAWTQDVVKSLSDLMVKEPKRLIGEFDFSKKAAHLSLTTKEVGGPASLQNWYVDMNKSVVSKELQGTLDDLGEEFVALEKKKGVADVSKESPSTSITEESQKGEVDNETLKGKTMSTELEVQLKKMQEELDIIKAEKEEALAVVFKSELAPFGLSEEVVSDITKSVSGKEAKALLVKALGEMQGKVDEAVADKEVIAKAAKEGDVKEPTTLEKALSADEDGVGTDASLSKEDVIKSAKEAAIQAARQELFK